MKVDIGLRETALVVIALIGLSALALFLANPGASQGGLMPISCDSNPSQSEIALPAPAYSGLALEEAIAKRRSVRDFSNGTLSLSELSQILWAGQGITDNSTGYRAAPSAGALYPLELYVIPNRVQGAGCGIYHYVPQTHKLVLVRNASARDELFKAAYAQGAIGNAAALIVLAAAPSRIYQKYGEAQGERFILMEAGHVSQNMLLESVSLGLGAAPIGGFSQSEVDAALGLDGKVEKALYMVAIGKKE